jgi:inner membrane protein
MVIKCGLLFIGLTFAAFFLFEVFKRLPIHPFQYSLIGIVLVLFYLLLLLLSEHFDSGSPHYCYCRLRGAVGATI